MQIALDTRFSGVQNLGPQVSQHPISRNDRFGRCYMALFCFGITLVMLKLTADHLKLANNPDSSVFVNTDPLFLYWPVVAGAVMLLVVIWMLVSLARNWNTAVVLYERGLAVNGPSGLRQFLWEDVDEVSQWVLNYYRNGKLSHSAYIFIVRTHDGQSFKLDNRFVDIEPLGNAIQRHVSALLLPRYVQALNNGQRVAFGPLAFDREQLYSGQKSLPWAEIKAVKLHQGKITVEQASGGKRKWASVSMERVPNLWVFYQIVGSLTTIE